MCRIDDYEWSLLHRDPNDPYEEQYRKEHDYESPIIRHFQDD